MTTKTLLALCFASASLTIAAHRAHADDVDVNAFEYVDVVETADGSVWKGILVEQVPNQRYKIATADGSLHVLPAGEVVKVTKAKNTGWRHGAAAPAPTQTQTAGQTAQTPAGSGPVATSEEGQGSATPIPTPEGNTGGNGIGAQYDGPEENRFAKNGLRLEADTTSVTPMGALTMAKAGASYGFTGRAGYELVFGKFGVGFGGQARITWWNLPGSPSPKTQNDDVAWTLETMLYARAALHFGRFSPYTGVAAGIDTNYVYSGILEQSNTTMGLGIDVQSGLAISVSPRIALDLGLDYHPGTDSLNSMSKVTQSSEYTAFHFGASLHL